MRPVIVAIDFSNTSIHSLEYAIMLANKMKSNIHLVWVDKMSSQESVYPDTSNENRMEAKKRFGELLEIYGPKLAKGISLEYKLKRGKIYREIDNHAQQADAELIVAGAHGISGFEEFWIGSNAYKIVSYASVPVITIRNDFPVKKKIERILIPIDGSAETLHKLPFVVKLATLFRSEVHLLTTHNSHIKSIQRIAAKLAKTGQEYVRKHGLSVIEDSIVATDLTKALLQYAEKSKADLVAIMTEQETPLNVHLGAQAQQLINQSPIPVLSVHQQEKLILA